MENRTFYHLGFNFTVALLITISLSFSVPAQRDKKTKPKKFGWSLKNADENSNKELKSSNSNNGNDDEIVKVETDLILNDVLVLDKKGEPVFGIKQNDFILTEDDKPQEIEVFSPPAAENQTHPRHFLLVVDYAYTSVNYSRNSIDAAKLFIDKLSPHDKMGIVSDDVKLIQDFTDDKIQLKNKLESVYKKFARKIGRGGGWGLTYTALHTALTEMFEEKGIRPIVILQSSGGEFDHLKGGKHDASRSPFGLHYGFYNFTFENLLRKIIEKRVTVHSIITGRRFVGIPDSEVIENMVLFQLDYQYDWAPIDLKSIEPPAIMSKEEVFVRRVLDDHRRWQPSMIKIAEISGGTSNFLQTPEDAKTIYSDILSSAYNRYLIGYYSDNQDETQKLRYVKIKVRGHPEYKVLSREAYIAR